MMKKIVSCLIAICMCFSSLSFVYAEESESYREITLSMYSNLTPEKSIDGLYKDNVFYITMNDLCKIAGGRILSQDDKKVKAVFSSETRSFEIIIGSDTMTEILNNDKLEIPMPSFKQNDQVYVSALHFLNYLGITVDLDKDAQVQFKVLKRYDVFDALKEMTLTKSGYFFWWDEVDTGNEKIEDKLLNAGVIALISRDPNIFRMVFDAKGIEQEAIQDALLSIVINEGQGTLKDSEVAGMLNDSNEMLGKTSDWINFISKSYDEDSKEATKAFSDKIGKIANTADSINTVVQVYENIKQFENMTNIQKNLLQDTILKYSRESETLCKDWNVIYDAAKNMDQQIKSKIDTSYKATLKKVQSKGYDLLNEGLGGPITLAWEGINFITKKIPFTKEIIDKKDKLYNSYNSSIIQLIANEMLIKSLTDWQSNNGYYKDSKKQIESLNAIKQLMILQLKSTLTTREYLLNSNFLTSNYADFVRTKNKKVAQLLNKVENCKINGINLFSSEYDDDLTWMETYESILSPEQANDLWIDFLKTGKYNEYTKKWNELSDDEPLEYTIYDLNADKVPELIIQSSAMRPFFNTAIFTLKNKQIVHVENMYGYGMLRYSVTENAVIGLPEVRPSVDYGSAPFYRLTDERLELLYIIFNNGGKIYISDSNGEKEISETERASHFTDIVEFEWKQIQSLK